MKHAAERKVRDFESDPGESMGTKESFRDRLQGKVGTCLNNSI